MPPTLPATSARHLLTRLAELGVECLFTNLGSDHPAFIEAFAALGAAGEPMPRVIVCPHEMTALSAAHGHAMISRKPQAVLVHVDVGTQNLGGSIHNAARGRVPAIVIAGLSPLTSHGERIGSRNEFIHFLQDTPRQSEIVGQYMKWCYELRAAETLDGVLLRALQIARSVPEGPVYLTGAREVWDSDSPVTPQFAEHWPPVRAPGLEADAVAEILAALTASRRPIVVTTYLGRNPEAVAALVELSDRIGVGVCEVSPQYMNFPGDHPHHLSYRRNALVAEADLILMVDVDVPWIPTHARPAAGARLFHVDIDPIKSGLGYWHFPAERTCYADSATALVQLAAPADGPVPGRAERLAWIADARARANPPAPMPTEGPITAQELTHAVRALVNDDTVVVFEEPSSTEIVPTHLRLSRPGSYFASGGSGLGWGINAGIGARLARPKAEVICLVGDGCYLFGVPSSAYWVASKYGTPQLTVIYNNGGWHSPKLSTLGVHPDGHAKRHDTYWVTIGADARLAQVAAAVGDVEACEVTQRADLGPTLRRAMAAVRSGRSAVVDVKIAPISGQSLG
jgi:acetolactate synthase I/II/III large subunit